ncbi:MAG TPA: hypothetical protein VFT72_18220 [Opitutaceae bacterium]|nr:hypothetical protein [Opitutaceae bacterium]
MTRTLTVTHFSPWAEGLELTSSFLARLPKINLSNKLSDPADSNLLTMARLDCDWHGENTRCFSAMDAAHSIFKPARVTGIPGLLDLAKTPTPRDEEHWLIFDGQAPHKLAGALGKLMLLLSRQGHKIGWYSFDESSRTTTAFHEIAPFLDLLIHDEFPLDPKGKALLKKTCVTIHRSWVANLIPFSVPFNEAPEEKILFLGSKLGLTDHRKRQIEFLSETFKDRFVAIHDHSVSVADRGSLNRYKVSLCPEGRKFTTPAMGMTHTDRPFWSGCLGMVPVSEDSTNGGRLEELAEKQLILRYAHGDLDELKIACEQALALPDAERSRIYDHFNRHETVGAVLAEALQRTATIAA